MRSERRRTSRGNKLSGKQLLETAQDLDICGIWFLEDAGSNVDVRESLFWEMDELEPESDGRMQSTIPQTPEQFL